MSQDTIQKPQEGAIKPEETKREKALQNMARIAYAETKRTEEFEELSSGEQEYYLDLAQQMLDEFEELSSVKRD